MSKSEASVETLVTKIECGELRLPEMQRRYVWRSTRVRDLFDSLYRGYPSGAILVWESPDEVALQEFAVDQKSTAVGKPLLLLDGQQRLTSLSAVIRGKPVKVRGRKRPVELLFNLDHPDHLAVVTEVDDDGDEDEDEDEDVSVDDAEEADSSVDELQKRFDRMAFVVATKKLEQRPQWVKVSEVFKTESDRAFLKRAGITDLDDPLGEKYSQRLSRLRAIRNYMYRLDVLERSLSYEEVTEIFVRVNSLGAKLRSSDLALAQITAKWQGALQTFQAFQKACATIGFELDLGLHLKTLAAFATGQSRFHTIGAVPRERLEASWIDCTRGMEYALNFLRSNVGIDSPALLSSPFLLVTLAFYGHARRYEISAEESARLRSWVLLANAKGRYTRGSTETYLDQDLTIVKNGGGANELIERLRLQVGRLDIDPDELAGRNQRSAFFKAMFLSFRAAGAKDWRSNLTIALDHSGSTHRLQFHHIFPKAILKGVHTTREADDIANLAFIGGRTNRQISDKSPAIYFPELIDKAGEAAFEAQCIPTDPSLLEVGRYKDFLALRRRHIAARLNEFLGTSGS